MYLSQVQSYWHGVMALMIGVLEWMDAGSLGRPGRGDKDWESPSMLVTSWSAWNSAWGWMRS